MLYQFLVLLQPQECKMCRGNISPSLTVYQELPRIQVCGNSDLFFNLLFTYFILEPRQAPCRISAWVPASETEPMSPAVRSQSLRHWTIRDELSLSSEPILTAPESFRVAHTLLPTSHSFLHSPVQLHPYPQSLAEMLRCYRKVQPSANGQS